MVTSPVNHSGAPRFLREPLSAETRQDTTSAQSHAMWYCLGALAIIDVYVLSTRYLTSEGGLDLDWGNIMPAAILQLLAVTLMYVYARHLETHRHQASSSLSDRPHALLSMLHALPYLVTMVLTAGSIQFLMHDWTCESIQRLSAPVVAIC